ncbi:FAD dependent oxidoreductase [Carbonactinospora thermoautotrophica]|uniref:FAD dependent oxidoreductase n=1 Tax=Carbonactinospora thermoautotrophica TaxID=1469144 RepID=A0A132MLG7_9ACTN|nr:FAD-dependent oxidoreductase [Carbonactinospora thermoautotrophica]KWW98595.1 FAD dependent oxidoreductase [Carbonactinospora thermoautotrophica]
MTNQLSQLPVVVIGAGPVGLAAAAHLHERGLPLLVLEAGDGPGSHVLAWGHVRMFSPWRYNLDAAAVRLLEAAGWTAPDADRLPTGAELVEEYLRPLAEKTPLAEAIRYRSRVVAVTRQGLDKTKTINRETRPFLVRYVDADGVEQEISARA